MALNCKLKNNFCLINTKEQTNKPIITNTFVVSHSFIIRVMQAENEILKRARNAKKSHFYTKKRHL